MILVDANLLVYAHASSLAQHGLAHAWLDEKLNGAARVGLPWPSLLGFVRLVSNPRIFQHAVTVSDAWRQVEEWLSCGSVWIPSPTERHSAVLGNILSTQPIKKSDLVPDAHLAALAIEHGLILCSTDGDFAPVQRTELEQPTGSRRTTLKGVTAKQEGTEETENQQAGTERSLGE